MIELKPKSSKEVKSFLTNTTPWCIIKGEYPEDVGYKDIIHYSFEDGTLYNKVPILTSCWQWFGGTDVVLAPSNVVDIDGLDELDLVLLSDIIKDIDMCGCQSLMNEIYSSLNDEAGGIVNGLFLNHLLLDDSESGSENFVISNSKRLGPEAFTATITWVNHYQECVNQDVYLERIRLVNVMPNDNLELLHNCIYQVFETYDYEKELMGLSSSFRYGLKQFNSYGDVYDRMVISRKHMFALYDKVRHECRRDNSILIYNIITRLFDGDNIMNGGGDPSEDNMYNDEEEVSR